MKNECYDLMMVIEKRLQQVFDVIQENPQDTKCDILLISYSEVLHNLLEEYNEQDGTQKNIRSS